VSVTPGEAHVAKMRCLLHCQIL